MTRNTTTVIDGPFTPNGSTTVFPFDFQASAADEVGVLLDDVEVDSALFSVSLNDDGTGQIGFFSAPTGAALYPFLDPEFDQPSTLRNQGPYFQAAIEAMIDREAAKSLWLRERVRLLFTTSMLTIASRANKFMSWDTEGNPFPSEGTGNDTAFRTDMAGPNGIALVGGLPGIVGRTVESFGALGDGVSNDLTALRLAMLALKNGTIRALHFKRGATYYIGAFNDAQTSAFGSAYLSGATGTIFGNGAKLTFTSDKENTHDVFLLDRFTDFAIESLDFEDTSGVDPAGENPQGVRCISAIGGYATNAEGLRVDRCKFNDTLGTLTVLTNDHTASGRVRRIRSSGCVATNCYYGPSFQNDGDDAEMDWTFYNVRRIYFPYGVSGHYFRFTPSHDGVTSGSDGCVSIGRYVRNTTGIHGEVIVSGSLAQQVPLKLVHQNDDGAASLIQDIDIRLTIPANTGPTAISEAVRIWSLDADGDDLDVPLALGGDTNSPVTTLHRFENIKLELAIAGWTTAHPHVTANCYPLDPPDVTLIQPQNTNRQDIRLEGFEVNGWFTVEKTGASLHNALYSIPLYHIRNSRYMVEMEVMAVEAVDGGGKNYWKRFTAHGFIQSDGGTIGFVGPTERENFSFGTPDLDFADGTGGGFGANFNDRLQFQTQTAADFLASTAFCRMRAKVSAVKA